MKSKRLMTIGIVLALLIAVVGVVLSVSLTACGKDVITVRSEKELLKAAGTSQEKTIVLMDDVVVNGDLKVAAPNKIDLNGFGLEVKGTLSADGSGTLVVGTTALILARRETVKAQKIDINMPQGHVEWNANIELPASAAASADAMTVVTSASSFVFKGVFKIGGAEADIMLTLKGGRFEISNLSESSAATVLVPEQAVGAAVENLSQGAMRVEAHSDVAVGGEVEISSKNSEVNVTALESQAETKITVTDGTVKKIDAAGAQVVVAESAQAGDVVAEKLENNGTVTGAVVADEIVNNGTLEEENVNAALKTAAKKALNDSFATYSQDDYTSDNWAKLTKAKDDGLAAIDSALTEAAIQSAKNAALDAMAAVETIAEATAEAKAAATAALKTAFEGYTETDYDAQTWATLKAAYDNGLAAIEAATDVSAVNTAKQTALDAMAACVPKDVEALTQAKAEAKAAIETAFEAYDEDDYASANWTELTIAYNKGLNEVDAATSVSAVNAAKQKALDAMAAVKNNATLLAEAKTAALAALDAAKAEYSQADYATNWSVLEKAYNDGKTEINAAVAIEAVNSALQKATDAMAAVKNDATLLAEAKTAATDQLNSEYAKYKATDYTNANYELLTEKYNAGLSAIGGARTVDAVETALETAVAEMAAIKTNAQILADAKAAAKQAVNEAFAAYNEQDYTVDNWSALVKVKDDGLAAIEAAAKTDVAAEAGEAAIAAMAAVKNNATLLAEAKATAKSELETEYKKYKKTDYTANWSQLESAYNSGLTAIENAATIELAQAAKEEAVTAMAAVKNDATLLAEAKTAAKSELGTEKAKYSQSDYTINWSVLEQAYNDGLTAIDASKTTSAVDTAKQAAIAAMAAVKTDAEELEAAKSAAKDELKEYFDAFNKAYYYETSLQALQTAYDSGVSAISAAQSVADVATALANAKTALDNVKADVTEVNDADSLKAAVEAQYSKIILTANISGAYIEVNYDLTLDLNGFGLVLEDRTHAAVKVNGGASFTLCDGSAAKSGKIKSDYAGIIAIGSDAGKAVVEINGGTIEVDNSAYWSNGASNVGYAVYADNAEVEMWGGEIIAKGQYVTEDDSVFGINLRNGSSATVHAGKIKSDTYGVVVYYNSAFTLDGGEITATWFAISGNNLAPTANITVKSGSATSTEAVAIYMPSQGSLTVSGGHIKGLAAIDARMGEIEISGGTLESTATEFKALNKKPGGVAVYDGSVVLFNVEMYVNDNTTSRPTGDGNNDFNAVVTGGTFVSAIEDGTYFSIYLWNTTTQSVTLGIDSQYGKIAWFDFVDSAVVNIVENCLADYAEEDYSAANWQAILDILDALETKLATVTDVSQIEGKVSAAQAKMAEIAKAKTIATAEQFSQAVAEQKDGDEWRIGASFEVAPFEITSSVSVVGTAADVTLTVNADAHFVTIKGANIEVSFKNIALAGKIDYNGIYFDSAATGAKLTLDNTGISNVKRGVSIAADNASVVINSSEIVARYYGVTVGASGVELSVNGGTVQGWAAIMFTANGWTVDRIKSNKGAVVNAQDAELVGRSISDEGYGIVVVQQDYNGAELTFSDCTMLTTVEDGKTGAWQGGIVVRSYGNKISVSGGYIESSNITERNLMGMALVSLYNTYFAQTEADPQDKANEFSISNWEIDESFETPFVLRDGIDTLTVDFGEPLEGTYAVQDERWYDINSTTENYSVESDLTAIVDQDFYVKNQGTLTIKAGATLTVESDVAFCLNDGNTLVIEAGATLVVKGAVVEGKIVNNGRVEVYGELAEQTSIKGNGEWVYGNVTEAEQLKALFANEALTNLTIILGADFGTEEARSEMSLTLERDAVVTLDMNGHSIYSSAQKVFWLNEGSLTVENGLIDVNATSQGFAFGIEPLSQDKVATLKLGSGLEVISHTYAPVFLVPQSKTDNNVLNAVLVTEADITSKCNYAAIQGNGTKHGTSITINGGKISGLLTAIYHPQYGEMTVNGGEIEGATAIEMRAGKLVVNSGTMIGKGDPFESDPNGNGATTLGAAVAAVQHTTKLDLSVEINGGTLQGARAFYQANLQNNGKEALEKISITLGKSAFYYGKTVVDSAEATIEDDQSTRYYMTLQQAVDAAEDDETVVVVKDLSASGAEYFITLDDESKTVTVDLNGKTLLYTGNGTGSNPQNGEAISVSAGKLVLKNGTVNMVNDEAGGSVYWGIRVHGTGSLAMSKVTVTSEDSPLFMSAVSTGGKIWLTLDECHIEGVYAAIYMNGSTSPAEITINNSTIVSKDVGIYVSNSVNTGNRQKLTITDSTVTGTTAIEVKHTDATITGCTLISTAAEQKSQINGNGSCTEGFAFAVTGNGDTDKTTGTVVVSGCKFYNGKPSSTDAEENGFYFVFTTAEGASVTVDGAAADETAAYGAYEARVSNAWFDTFENAVKYAEANGKTVVLLKDVEVGEAGNAATGLVVSGTVTVDFNGFTVSNVGTGYAVVVSGSDAKVTLIDSSKEQTGGIYGGSGGDNQALRVESGATLDIYGGNYNVGGDPQGEGNSTVAISTDSVVYIYGGRFASEKAYKGKYFVLNIQQTTGAKGEFKVFGGTFVGQNPADGDDALGGSFVAKGYEAFVSKEATDDSLAEYTVGKVYEAGSEEALRGAIAAAQGFSVVRLTADVDLKEELYINGVDLMLDLNGFTLSLHYGEGVKRKNCSTLYVANATLIINDSSEDKSGRVENTDTTGGTNLSSKDNNYAVRVGREANLIINGGTFYTSADSAGNGNSVILIYSTSSNESTVTINGGVFETEAAYNGTYFVLNVQDGFKGGYVVCGGTFKGYKPGTTNTGELATVPEGYEIAEQEIENGVVWYTVQKAQ
jgi:extracellular matrix binding protein